MVSGEPQVMAHLRFRLQLGGVDEIEPHTTSAIRTQKNARLIRGHAVLEHVIVAVDRRGG